MSDEKLLEFKKVAHEEGATLGIYQSNIWDKSKSLRITKAGGHAFAPVTEVKDGEELRQWIRYMFPQSSLKV